MSKIKIVH